MCVLMLFVLLMWFVLFSVCVERRAACHLHTPTIKQPTKPKKCDWFGVVCCNQDGKSITSAYEPAQDQAPPATYNVSCPAEGAVVGLQLISNKLAGEVTAAFVRAAIEPLAPYMLYLYLRDNNVTGPLAPLLRGMRRLQRFGVTSCVFVLLFLVASVLFLCCCPLCVSFACASRERSLETTAADAVSSSVQNSSHKNTHTHTPTHTQMRPRSNALTGRIPDGAGLPSSLVYFTGVLFLGGGGVLLLQTGTRPLVSLSRNPQTIATTNHLALTHNHSRARQRPTTG